jgi:hypothetical protein
VMPSERRSCVCVNQNLMFNCSINGTGITEWSGTAIDCSDGLLLRHIKFLDVNGTMKSCGQITARSIRVDNGCYSSQLTATATAAQNNTYVRCIHRLNEEQNLIGAVSLTVISGENACAHNFIMLQLRTSLSH